MSTKILTYIFFIIALILLYAFSDNWWEIPMFILAMVLAEYLDKKISQKKQS